MNLNTFFQWQSLKTRVTLITLAIFLIGIWSLTFYASRMLRKDMQDLLGDQQFATVSILAREINHELDDRLRGLELVAATINPAILSDTTALQALIEQRAMLQEMFNGGILAHRPDGTAIAEVPLSAGRLGVNYMDVDTVAAALKQGKSTIGRPVMGRKLMAPVFGMAVPIRDAQGKVIGALGGVVNLGKPNFLDQITESHYGKTGGYALVAPQYRLVVTATDKSRVMHPLPAPGINRLIDRDVQGYEGYGILVNPTGVEVLSSAKGIPAAGWYLAALLPTAEAFAPIHAMQQRVLLATLFLTLLMGSLTWWLLRREFSPMLATVRELAAMSFDTKLPLLPLPIANQDEIGQLIGGFNQLLEILTQREVALGESQAQLLAITDNASAVIFLKDLAGRYIHVNRQFQMLFCLPDTTIIGKTDHDFFPRDVADAVVRNDQTVIQSGQPLEAEEQVPHEDGIHTYLSIKFPIRNLAGEIWATGTIATDITERKQAEEQRLAEARQQRDTLVREVHHRIKNHLQGVAGLLQRELGQFVERDPRLAAAISQVNAVAVVHGLQSVNSDEAIRLCDSVRNICKTVAELSQRPVLFQIEGELTTFEPIRIASSEAVPVALVLNELILNAVKHSPEGSAPPTVSLSADGSSAQIVVRNALKGVPRFNIDSGESLGTGLRLVRSLLPNQGAQLAYEVDQEGFMLTRLTLTAPVVDTTPHQEPG